MSEMGNIIVKDLDGVFIELQISKNDYISKIILKTCGDRDPEYCSLIYGSQILSRNSSLREAGISFESFFKLVENEDFGLEIAITVKTLVGKVMHHSILRSSTILDLKKRIHDMEGVPTEVQIIIFKRIQLEDFRGFRTLRSYGIKEGSELNIIHNLRGG